MKSICRLSLAFLPLALGFGEVSVAAYNPRSVAAAWENHADAFGSEDLDKIMLDYRDTSIVELYDASADSVTIFEGRSSIRTMFSDLFTKLGTPNPFTVPVNPVIEEPAATMQFGQVFLLWEAASKGFPRVTDTFVFEASNFTILRQNIVVFPLGGCPTVPTVAPDTVMATASSAVQMAWDNHFAAFGEQNVSKIMLDYSAASKAMFYDNVANSPITVNEGMTAIQAMFTNLFSELADRSDVAVPLIHTSTFGLDGDKAGEELGQTFLIWRSPADGYAYVTDTFVYSSTGVILRQNIVAMKKDPCASYSPQSVSDAWKNHAEAFASEDLEKIMLDYTANSMVELYDAEADRVTIFEGTSPIRAMFSDLFAKLGSPNPFTVPVDPVIEEPTATRRFGHVFLLWEAAGKGFARVTDTFVYGALSFKILRQNIVVFPSDGCPTVPTGAVNTVIAAPTSAVQMAWDNHFAAFVDQNVSKIMLDYSAGSKAMIYDNVANSPITVNEGMVAIGAMFAKLFSELVNRSDVAVPLVHTSTFGFDGDKAGAGLGQTFLIWRSPIDGYAYVTDTFVYSSSGVILRQNIVAMKKDPCVSTTTTTRTSRNHDVSRAWQIQTSYLLWGMISLRFAL